MLDSLVLGMDKVAVRGTHHFNKQKNLPMIFRPVSKVTMEKEKK